MEKTPEQEESWDYEVCLGGAVSTSFDAADIAKVSVSWELWVEMVSQIPLEKKTRNKSGNMDLYINVVRAKCW